MIVDWKDNLNGTVTLTYSDGDRIVVNKSDFVRAFGTMINATKAEVRREFGIR